MIVIALIMIAATALVYAASTLQYHGYDWADSVCAHAPDACASPHYVAIATVAVIGIYSVLQTIKNAK